MGRKAISPLWLALLVKTRFAVSNGGRPEASFIDIASCVHKLACMIRVQGRRLPSGVVLELEPERLDMTVRKRAMPGTRRPHDGDSCSNEFTKIAGTMRRARWEEPCLEESISTGEAKRAGDGAQ
jgi:hypothetical protein